MARLKRHEVPSLFVVSLPRSLSTLIYHAARQSLGLKEPIWTSAGEILNLDRFALMPGPARDFGRKFLRRETDSEVYAEAMAFLNHTVAPTGHGYKDVVQPFLLAEWMETSGFRALRIKRNVADVAYSMLTREWHYPSRLFPRTKDLDLAMVRGLVLADRALDSIPAQHVDFDELIHDEASIDAAVRTLYGARVMRKRVSYIDDRFKRVRARILRRRRTARYQAIADRLAQVSARDRP
jgi:hypothetical protein